MISTTRLYAPAMALAMTKYLPKQISHLSQLTLHGMKQRRFIRKKRTAIKHKPFRLRALHKCRRVPELCGEGLRERPGADDGDHRGVGLGVESHDDRRHRRGQGRSRAQHDRLRGDEPVPERQELVAGRCRSRRCSGGLLAAMLEIHGAISTREVQMSIQLDEWNGCVCDEIIWWMAVYAKKKKEKL